MPLLLAVTGAPGVGKSTLVRRILERLDCKTGGLLTRERRVEGKLVGFELLDLATGETGTLATIEGPGPRLGRYRVNLFDLENIGARSIERAADGESDLIVIDEVGPMELSSRTD